MVIVSAIDVSIYIFSYFQIFLFKYIHQRTFNGGNFLSTTETYNIKTNYYNGNYANLLTFVVQYPY